MACNRFPRHPPKLIPPAVRTPSDSYTDHRMSALGIIEAFNVIEHVGYALIPAAMESFFSSLKTERIAGRGIKSTKPSIMSST